jgi:hypothetical protein
MLNVLFTCTYIHQLRRSFSKDEHSFSSENQSLEQTFRSRPLGAGLQKPTTGPGLQEPTYTANIQEPATREELQKPAIGADLPKPAIGADH